MTSSTSSPSLPSWSVNPPRLIDPSTDQLWDMIRFYATAGVRDALLRPLHPEEEPLEDRLVDDLRKRIESWAPTHEWYWRMVHLKGRTVEWLAWVVAISADPEWASVYRDEPILPFAIDVDTLPTWGGLPAMVVHPDRADDASAPVSTQQ